MLAASSATRRFMASSHWYKVQKLEIPHSHTLGAGDADGDGAESLSVLHAALNHAKRDSFTNILRRYFPSGGDPLRLSGMQPGLRQPLGSISGRMGSKR